MQNFIFHNPVKIYFGKGQAANVTAEAQARPGAVLVVYGGGSIKHNGAYDDVMQALREAGGSYRHISRNDARAILAACAQPVVF